MIIYIRFKHIDRYYKDSVPKVDCLNVVSLFLAVVSAFGLIVVGAFQVIIPPPLSLSCLYALYTSTCTQTQTFS